MRGTHDSQYMHLMMQVLSPCITQTRHGFVNEGGRHAVAGNAFNTEINQD